LKRVISLFLMCIVSVFLPQAAGTGKTVPEMFGKSLVAMVAPVFSYHEELLAKDALMLSEAEYENKRAAEVLSKTEEAGNGAQAELVETDGQAGENDLGGTADSSPEESTEGTGDSAEQAALEEPEQAEETPSSEASGGSSVLSDALTEKLQDFDYLIQNYYAVDSSTTIKSSDLNAGELLAKDLSVSSKTEGPQILIYHTHSQEGYQDSVEGDASTSVVALGERLAELLTEQYGFSVLHHTGEYDVGDRDHAYSNAAPALEKILSENPSIEVVIDLHRDSVADDTHLTTTVNGKKTAKIMFFNGLCRTTASGDLTGLTNPYLQDNLAFSLQMQLLAAEKYPGLTRKIYLKGYRYNMHYCPKSLLVEVGAQNNTFEEGMNAMEPLAELLAEVLQSK
jgi:stage II sporulation protein P